MKINYLNELKTILVEENVKKSEINQIIIDYKELYEQGLEQGLTDEEIISKLGNPKFVYNSLRADLSYQRSRKEKSSDWITGIVVFIAIILFMVTGLAFNMWEYGWLFFLLIPISAILNNSNKKQVLPGLSVFIATIVFFILGYSFNLWHPGWLIFTIIPIAGLLSNTKTRDKLMGIVVFSTIIVYFFVSYLYTDFYLFGWPLFLFIPLVGTIYIENKKRRAGAILALLISIVLYYILSVYYNNWVYPLFVFLIPFVYSIINNQFRFDTFNNKAKLGVLIGMFVFVVYMLISLATKAWDLTWLILLLIPMISIYINNGFKNVVAYIPFIAIIIFFLVGSLFEGGFKYSWMVFFLIPIVGILENRKPKRPIDDEEEIELINLDE